MSKYIMQKNDISTYLESSNLQIVSAVFTKKRAFRCFVL